jgi:hypothetical protein
VPVVVKPVIKRKIEPKKRPASANKYGVKRKLPKYEKTPEILPFQSESGTSRRYKLLQMECDELEKYLSCPICPHRPKVDLKKLAKKGVGRKIELGKAKSKLVYHYNSIHLPVQVEDVLTDEDTGEEYYKCTICEYEVPVVANSGRIQERIRKRPIARIVLGKHYVNSHLYTEDRDKLPQAITDEQFEVNPCPHPICQYTVEHSISPDDAVNANRRESALKRLSKHFILRHDYNRDPRSSSNLCVKKNESTGEDWYKCPSCEFSSLVAYPPEDGKTPSKIIEQNKNNAREFTSEKLQTHFIVHLFPDETTRAEKAYIRTKTRNFRQSVGSKKPSSSNKDLTDSSQSDEEEQEDNERESDGDATFDP